MSRRLAAYIMPPMPPIPGAPIGISGLSSFLSQITHSVVRNMPATELHFERHAGHLGGIHHTGFAEVDKRVVLGV